MTTRFIWTGRHMKYAEDDKPHIVRAEVEGTETYGKAEEIVNLGFTLRGEWYEKQLPTWHEAVELAMLLNEETFAGNPICYVKKNF